MRKTARIWPGASKQDKFRTIFAKALPPELPAAVCLQHSQKAAAPFQTRCGATAVTGGVQDQASNFQAAELPANLARRVPVSAEAYMNEHFSVGQ